MESMRVSSAAMTSSAIVSDQTWRLAKYAYFTGPPSGGGSDANRSNWKFHEGKTELLTLVVTSSCHLVVMLGSIVQESYSLVNAGAFMKGVSKGDSLLLLCKTKDKTQRFRTKFYGGDPEGATRCNEAVTCLQQHFPIKRLDVEEDHSQDNNNTELCEGNISMGTLTKVLLGELRASLPLVYSETNFPTDQLNTLIKLCLRDVNFPAFVDQVHQELKAIVQDEL